MGTRVLKQLPVEIIEEILLNLPFKSLLRFKSVSKSWRSSISSRSFITGHLDKLNSGTDLANNHNLIFAFLHGSDSTPIACVGSFSIGSLLDDDDVPINRSLCPNLSIPIPDLEGNNPITDPVFKINLLGSCNGLILISIGRRELHLWNPATRKSKKIPHPQGTFSWGTCGHGFGYDESTRDYKVVSIFSCLKPNQPQEMCIYSSRTDSWKKIPSFNQRLLIYDYARFVNGKLHWVTTYNDASSRWRIVSLDFVEEKYQIVPLPQRCSDYDDSFRPYLENLGGHLCFTYCNYVTGTVEVWAMMKYGEKESWSEILTFFGVECS